MKSLHPQFELLISYADGNADAEMQRQAVDLINSDAEAAEFYQSLQVTAQPIRESAARSETTVPQDIINRIKSAQPDELVRRIADNNADTTIQPTPAGLLAGQSADQTVGEGKSESKRFGRLALPVAMAASLFCGLIGGALLYSSASGFKTNTGEPVAIAQSETPEWVRLVADYHRLYVRDTITASTRQEADAVSQRVSETLQTSLTVPSLEQQGIEFRRAQWLAIDEQPLLQLAYLPESGRPLAVCVLTKSTSQDTAAEYGETGGMQYVHWQTGEHAVVIVGTVSPAELQEIYGVVEEELL